MSLPARLMDVYRSLERRYGPQHWWPGDTPFEVMVGAVLTQAVSWSNVEKAIANLKTAGALSPEALRSIPLETLAGLLHPSGYYNAKARKIKALVVFLKERFDDDLDRMSREDPGTLRNELLAVHGVGEETADCILLYALGMPAVVVDTYTRRVLARLGLAPVQGAYGEYRELLTRHLPPEPELFNEYHALLVRHGGEVCRKQPLCDGCCLLDLCPTGRANVSGARS